MRIYALDVETANANYESICQIGIAKIDEEKISDVACWYINPEEYFDPFNVEIHGISEDMVCNAPTLPRIYTDLRNIIESSIIVHHMPFDRVAMKSAFEKYDLDWIDSEWLDSARIVRRTWTEFSQRGYGLANVAAYLGFQFNHHNALEDAKAAAQIILAASRILDMSIPDMVPFSKKKKNTFKYDFTSLSINEDGPLFGHSMVFTGALAIPRKKAAEIAAAAGCAVQTNVTKSTDMIVIGIQDKDKLNGYEKSNKHRKAETLIRTGQDIRILTERDFYKLVADWIPENLNLERKEKGEIKEETGISITFSFEDILSLLERSGLLNKKR